MTDYLGMRSILITEKIIIHPYQDALERANDKAQLRQMPSTGIEPDFDGLIFIVDYFRLNIYLYLIN